MGSETVHKPFRFLHLPAELRDMVYDHVLFAPSFPTNTIDKRLRNINVDAQIHTNILFANRQVFEEAKETILRAGLVLVVSRGFSPEFLRDTVVLVDQIPVLHRKYESLCFMTHRVVEDLHDPTWECRTDISCVILRDDIGRFCRGVCGYGVPFLNRLRFLTTGIDDNFRHELLLMNPRASLSSGPAQMPKVINSHRRLLEIYRSGLHDCKRLWIWDCPDVDFDRDFIIDMARKTVPSGCLIDTAHNAPT
ncbi:hypothetical protein N8I77_000127 [Diaporthe amygdali]|uniref:Uncharacterized protein n=1 Tax=Phomopsis amygdali TaxID=1214568 RepID=A0AAD9W6W3_PHOAM|nr:hypothetical protein N8I77_000127 [Diaporthe amygdali]